MSQRLHLLFIAPGSSTFIRNDQNILSKTAFVESFLYRPGDFLTSLISQTRMIVWLLTHLWQSHIIYIWFADYHSLIPALLGKIFRKKVVVILGGYDVACVPELHYGAHLDKIRSLCVKLTCKWANYLLPVSKFVWQSLQRYVNRPDAIVVYNGVETNQFQPGLTNRDQMAMAVFAASKTQLANHKGLPMIKAVAKRMPDITFIIIGLSGQALQTAYNDAPPNLKIFEPMPQKELVHYYQRATVFLQFSKYESFGMVVAEAMACGCVPVGIDTSATPEIMGEAGFLVSENNITEAVQGIKKAFSAFNQYSAVARQRVLSLFSLENRAIKLMRILQSEPVF